jgi:hypothetical protein
MNIVWSLHSSGSRSPRNAIKVDRCQTYESQVFDLDCTGATVDIQLQIDI